MGVKTAARTGHHEDKMENEVDFLNELSHSMDSSHLGAGDDFIRSGKCEKKKKKTKREDTYVSDVEQIGKRKKRKKKTKRQETYDNDVEQIGKRKKKKKKTKRQETNVNDVEQSSSQKAAVNLEGDVELDNIEMNENGKRKRNLDQSNYEKESLSKRKKGKVGEDGNNVIEGNGGKILTAESNAGVGKAEGGVLNVVEGDKKEKKRKKRKTDKDVGDDVVMNGETNKKENGSGLEHIDQNIVEEVGKKKKKRKCNGHLEATLQGIMGENLGNESGITGENIGDVDSNKRKIGGAKMVGHVINAEVRNKVKRKKGEIVKNGLEENASNTAPRIEKGVGTTNPSKKFKLKGKSRRVTFSEDVEVEVFHSGDGLVRGRRFSKEEDEMVKDYILNYIDTHQLGEEGLEMVLHCEKYPKVKHCWKEIGAVLPHRPNKSIYYRAHTLFERVERSWTPEECEIVQKFHEKHGSDWKTLADALGKNRVHVKDTWRRIKLPNVKKGKWSQDEYQSLYDLVNKDMLMKAFEEFKYKKHGMLRDNISWTAISEKLETRSVGVCCMKWYNQLASPMVAEGMWLDTDDYCLLIALYDLDACCMEDVDWDNLLEHRSGDVCRKRWNEMVKHLGEHRNKSFGDQVEVLIRRYCPDVLDAREIYDSKPVVL